MPDLYDNWCDYETVEERRKTLWRLTEREGGRDAILEELSKRVLSHYVADEEIAAFLDALEFPEAAECIRTLMPTAANIKSGDLGEILAAELIEEWLGFNVPVKKLRDKDHREMAMRGEDMIGVAYDNEDRLKLLKGEAKSAQALSKDTVEKARIGLEKNYGRPSAHSLIFVARRLIKSDDPDTKELGADILKEAATRAVPKRRLAHLMFTLSGNPATEILKDDFDTADGGREQHSFNLRIRDHGAFVDAVFEEALAFGND